MPRARPSSGYDLSMSPTPHAPVGNSREYVARFVLHVGQNTTKDRGPQRSTPKLQTATAVTLVHVTRLR